METSETLWRQAAMALRTHRFKNNFSPVYLLPSAGRYLVGPADKCPVVLDMAASLVEASGSHGRVRGPFRYCWLEPVLDAPAAKRAKFSLSG